MTKTGKLKLLKGAVATLGLSLAVSAAAAENETVTFGTYGGTTGNMHAFLADKEGLCEEYGFDCQFAVLNTGPLQLQAMLGGSIDVGYFVPEVAFGGINRGADIQAGAGGVATQPYVVVARSDIELPNLDKGYPENMIDLKGKTIGVPARGSGAELLLMRMLADVGLTEDDVTLVGVGGPGTALPALTVGKQIDAMINFPPSQHICNASGACVKIVDPSQGEGPEVITGMIGASVPMWFTRDFIESDPARMDKLIEMMAEMEVWMTAPENLDAVLDHYMEWIPFTSMKGGDELRRTWIEAELNNYRMALSRDAFKTIHDHALENGLIDSAVDLDAAVYSKAPE
ncbi:ABC-type nitrate/sulfonate/bicarbonate transport system, substrate-binding protein [Shimia gijangensis]|uniref:ABC-type nitrate/sulfonate/bicarbonate transport system, substrate-binding protein n=1 Tax=Shimia gijangensis TaxID=1470563 RepID=A0A1M6T735_9RHOB|nr:ABC transporter substrate-binding protein [Shimia gijangensis]SHK52724.1 ABC-type nitrate/sulfonate/bicarbonate transport system, substrate-binding protein [Shimia gijangensis]